MKLPYRTGDSFELPLGDGRSVRAVIAACHHHVVEIAVGERTLRVFDDALVLHRWRAGTCHGELVEAPFNERTVIHDNVVGPAHAERLVAEALDVATFDDGLLAVFEMCDEISSERLASLPRGAMLSWSRPLAGGALERVLSAVALRDDLQLRLHDGAAAQAGAFIDVPLRALILAGPWSATKPFERVRELTLDAPLERPPAQAFPNLRSLHVTAGAKRLDPRMLGGLQHLEMLDVSHVGLAHGQTLEVSALPALRALRAARVDGLRSLRNLEHATALRTLSVEHQHLDSLAPLGACRSIEQLELLGMWQFAIGDLEWLHDLPHLLRADVDIGGRRKNLELYRRARWAYPWPEFSGVRATLIEPRR